MEVSMMTEGFWYFNDHGKAGTEMKIVAAVIGLCVAVLYGAAILSVKVAGAYMERFYE